MVFTGRAHGDLQVDGDPATLAARRRAVVDLPWTWLRQVHGAEVVTVGGPGEHAGAEADAAVTATTGAALAVHTADCAPVVLLGEGAVGVVHAGWRGVAAGVLPEAVARLRVLAGGPEVQALLGPCIRPAAYEFGREPLAELVGALGQRVRGTTAWGTPALDLPAAVAASLAEVGVAVEDLGGCTATGESTWWSHRARGDEARQATVVWIEPASR